MELKPYFHKSPFVSLCKLLYESNIELKTGTFSTNSGVDLALSPRRSPAAMQTASQDLARTVRSPVRGREPLGTRLGKTSDNFKRVVKD